MFTLSRNFLKFTAASSLLVLTAISTPAGADEMVQNLGPVAANEPILTTVGNQRVIAFYEPDNGHCAVNAIVYDKNGPRHRHDHGGACSGQPSPRPDCIDRRRREQLTYSPVR